MSRLLAVRQAMRQEAVDAFVVMNPANVRYLSRFTGSTATLLITLEQAFLLTDSRYIEQAKLQAGEYQTLDTEGETFRALGLLAAPAPWERIAFEGTSITFEDYGRLSAALKGKELCSHSSLIKRLRSVKDEGEIALIRQAVALADQAFAHLLRTLAVGQTEAEISLALEFHMRQAGASGGAFEFIVASGWRSAMPHGVASPKKTAPGELLTLDFGAVYEGYCSDMTRTLCLGIATEQQREIYEIVLAANKAGIAAIKPGIKGREVDAAARKLIADAGYGAYFGHGLGHSLGLEIHEGPSLNKSEEQTLEPGMVVTVEPGIYLPSWGGVRIEDLVLVTERGGEVLTQAPKEFMII
ncbi:MAG: Xaa-Pro peptidase family protein [Peptococcaceae bacterium]|jgi:Xaa-Pro aminopeptidase|nr:Xaa-Pro peptidase family protein [Peptococcaceae bacterium]